MEEQLDEARNLVANAASTKREVNSFEHFKKTCFFFRIAFIVCFSFKAEDVLQYRAETKKLADRRSQLSELKAKVGSFSFKTNLFIKKIILNSSCHQLLLMLQTLRNHWKKHKKGK